jgi:hypothetical protein
MATLHGETIYLTDWEAWSSLAAERNYMATVAQLTESNYLELRHKLADVIRQIEGCAYAQEQKLGQRGLAEVVAEEFKEVTGVDILELV